MSYRIAYDINGPAIRMFACIDWCYVGGPQHTPTYTGTKMSYRIAYQCRPKKTQRFRGLPGGALRLLFPFFRSSAARARALWRTK